ncbi:MULTISPECIES: hypothetical protein [unclassified Prochlorococcus]|uniref:hypothetical protein n=1 Tax=unclassified Prochlorococcus TaxID=2627481 RepID=UPI0005338EA3|nr:MULTISPECIES: hypothetical protein [unclassified Prochlorococcus]KGG27462.1 hypothetical protein EV13_2127 [Prochlorococcus sp. MIT 0702]KGG27683.1 hypothetical protein EV12_1113 [Prochlorococcus sp. MIT 0701]KGG31922.1 hypothetical protein EV14_2130 [Prochlorococcus sp. MIT 0703]
MQCKETNQYKPHSIDWVCDWPLDQWGETMFPLNDGIRGSDFGLETTQEVLIAGQASLQEMQAVN